MVDSSSTPRNRQRAAPIVCGHRGAPVAIAENTLGSFRAAAQAGATWIEFDVRPCLDDLVVHHDPVTAAGVHVGSTPRTGLDPTIPTLHEVIETFGAELGFDVELKTDDIGIELTAFVARVIEALDGLKSAVASAFMVTSFDAAALELARRERPDYATGYLFHEGSIDDAIEIAVAAGHQSIAPWHPMVDTDLVQKANQAGLGVATWTVNEPVDIRRVADAGVDMIIGDDPGLIASTIAD